MHEAPLNETSQAPPLKPTTLVVGLILGAVLFTVASEARSDFVASDVGLGLETMSVVEDYEDRPLTGRLVRVEETSAQVRTLRDSGRPVALWLGASQLHAINQIKANEHLAAWHASEAARQRGTPLAYVQTSAPNANHHELLGLYLAYRQRDALPQALVLGFTYDDLAEPGVRAESIELLRPLGPDLSERLGEIGEALLPKAPPQPDGLREADAPRRSPQEQLEDHLVTWIERAWPAYGRRSVLQAAAITAWKVPLTRLIFKFFKRPKRRVPAHLKTWNGAALDALIKLVRDDGVELFVYKAPIRPDPHFFLHDRGSYDAYHVELQARVEALGGHWLDIEGLVPMDLWGVGIVGLPDVFHFREIGHQLLGAAIDAWLAEKLVAVVPPRVER